MPIAPTSQLPEGLHYRLHYLLSGLSENEWDKTFVHLERGKMFRIRDMICLYAWQGSHHLAHITTVAGNCRKIRKIDKI